MTNLASHITKIGEAVKDPTRGKPVFRATGTGETGVRAEIRIGNHTLTADEGPVLGGERPGFGDVRVRVTLHGPADPQRYRELAAAVDAHCPVLDVFRNPTPVTTEIRSGQDGAHE